MSYSVKIILDSIDKKENRLTTFKITFPRIILSEFNTHRMFSRNSASSRAIPFSKMVQSVMDNPFIPIKFMKTHKGMQGTEYFTSQSDIQFLTEEWIKTRDNAIHQAGILHKKGLTKQLCNRLLESFMWHTVIVTATGFENFFYLRAHPAAEIHIQKIAYKMLEKYNKNTPTLLEKGEWHIPFVEDLGSYSLEDKIKVAVARSARVSYTVIGEEKTFDIEKDIALHNQLISMGHFSPTEHIAQCTNTKKWYGNFRGWHQYRKTLINECKNDERIGN